MIIDSAQRKLVTHCWLGHLTRKTRPQYDMTYNVFGGTLNLALSIIPIGIPEEPRGVPNVEEWGGEEPTGMPRFLTVFHRSVTMRSNTT